MHWHHLKRSAVARLLAVVATALVVWPAASRADITAFSATAGVPFNGTVAVINAGCLNIDCRGINPSIDINWGDGTLALTRVAAVPDCPSPTDPCPGPVNWTVKVPMNAHTYAQPGTYQLSLVGPIFGTHAATATVTDDPASIVETAPPLKPVVGATFSGAIATFTDTNPLVQASEFTATINWGDGNTTPATVTPVGMGQPFQVSGSHVYAHVGTFAVTVAIHHVPAGVDGASASSTTTATVSDAALTGAGNAVTAVAGVPFSGAVATFADPNPFAKATDFAATITWGNEATTPGTVTTAPGGFAVSGSHTFAGSGQIPVKVVVSSIGGSTATIGTVASVSAAPPPPVTTVALSPAAPNGKHGWYRSVVHASVSARSVSGSRARKQTASRPGWPG